MSQTLRRLAASKPSTKPKLVASTVSPEAWRLELEKLDEDTRFLWEERVAILLAGRSTGLSLEQAEKSAYFDILRT